MACWVAAFPSLPTVASDARASGLRVAATEPFGRTDSDALRRRTGPAVRLGAATESPQNGVVPHTPCLSPRRPAQPRTIHRCGGSVRISRTSRFTDPIHGTAP